jgi:hypothetical protein
VTFATASAHGIAPGQQFAVSPSANPIGYAGTYRALTGTSGTTLVALIAGSPGAFTSATLEGRWSGNFGGVPVGWPYFVSVRPANLAANTAYATLPSPIAVGAVNSIDGQSQAGIMMGMTTPGLISSNLSEPLFYAGIANPGFETGTGVYYGVPLLDSYLQGAPSVLNVDPSAIQNATTSYLSNAQIILQQSEAAGLALAGFPAGIPTSELNFTRNGTQSEMWLTGYTTQVQQIGTGNGSATRWCSASNFCSNVGSAQAASHSQNGTLTTLVANQVDNSLNAAGFGAGGTSGPPEF